MRHARTFSAARRRACRPDRLRTIAVGRHVLLIADVRVEDRAGPAGSRIRDTEQDGQARVLALGLHRRERAHLGQIVLVRANPLTAPREQAIRKRNDDECG